MPKIIPTVGGEPILTDSGGIFTLSDSVAGPRIQVTHEISEAQIILRVVGDDDAEVLGKGSVVTVTADQEVAVFAPEISTDPEAVITIRARKVGTEKWGPVLATIDLSDLVSPPPPPPPPPPPEDTVKFLTKPALTFSSTIPQEGDTVTTIPPDVTITPVQGWDPITTVTYERRAGPSGTPTTGSNATTLIASFTGDQQLRVIYTIENPEDDTYRSESDWYTVRDIAIIAAPKTGDATIERYEWAPEGQTAYYEALFKFPGFSSLAAENIRWTAAAASETNPPWHNVEPVAGETGVWRLRANNHPVAPGAFDAATWLESETARRNQLTFSIRANNLSPWSARGAVVPVGVKTVPATPATIGASAWTFTEKRDVAPLGRGVATVPATTILSGYDLRLYVGDADNPTPTRANTVSVAAPSTTTSTYAGALGGTVWGSLWWLKAAAAEADDVWSRAATLSKSFVVAGLQTDAGPNLWRPLALVTPDWDDTQRDPDLYDANRTVGGEGIQNSHVFMRFGKRTWFGGDMCGIRFCDDDRRWTNPPARGLRGIVFHAIGVDPDDENRVIVAAGMGVYRGFGSSAIPTLGEQGRFYLSTDRAHTFSIRSVVNRSGQDVPEITMPNRITRNLSPLCHLSGAATPTTRKWRLITFNDKGGGARFWKSDNGGQSWTEGANVLPTALTAAGVEIYLLVAHPTTANTYWAVTSVGVWATTDDGGSWSQHATLTTSTRGYWVDPETPNTRLATRLGSSGLWYTTQGATGWTQTLNGSGVHATTLAVGPKWSETVSGVTRNYRTLYVCNDASQTTHKSVLICHWDTSGAPPNTRRSPLTMAATGAAPRNQWFCPYLYVPDDNPHWRQFCDGGGSAKVAPDPTDKNKVAGFGFGFMWWSDDGGARMRPAIGYMGMNSQAMYVDPARPSHAALGINDVALTVGRGTAPAIMSKGGFGNESPPNSGVEMYARACAATGVTSLGATGVVILPEDSRLVAAQRSKIILAAGDYQGNQIIMTGGPNNWVWWKNAAGDDHTATQPLYRGYLDENPNTIFFGTARSTDGGVSWVTNATGGRFVCGTSKQTSGIAFAASSDGTVLRTANSTAATPTWATWATNLDMNADRSAMFWLDPRDDTRAIARHSNGDFCYIVGETVTLQLNLRGAYVAGGHNLPAGKLSVTGLGWCPLNRYRVTAFSKSAGLPQLWEGLFNSHWFDGNAPAWSAGTYALDVRRNRNGKVWRSTAASNTTTPGETGATWADEGAVFAWRDITRNFPCTSNTRDMIVHPVTGERIASCGQGIWVLPPDDAVQTADFWWPKLPKPIVATRPGVTPPTTELPTWAAGDWTVTEKRDAAPEGRRNITIGSKTIPDGYTMRILYSTTAGATPTSDNPTLATTSPASFTTSGTHAVGVTVYTTLWLRKTSDSSETKVSADEKSTVIQGLIPVTPIGTFPTPSDAGVTNAIGQSNTRYHYDASDGGFTGTYGSFAHVFIAAAAAAGVTKGFGSNNTTPVAKTLAWLRYLTSSTSTTAQGNMWASPGGQNMRHELYGVCTTAIASTVPAIWDELTDRERGVLHLGMLSSAYANMYIADDSAPSRNVRGGGNPRSNNGNISHPYFLGPYVVAAYLGPKDGVSGGTRLQTLANDMTVSGHAAALLARGGLKDNYDTWNGVPHTNGPTATTIQNTLDNWTTLNGLTLNDASAAFVNRLNAATGATIRRGLPASPNRYGLGPNPENLGVWEPSTWPALGLTGGRNQRVGCINTSAVPPRNGETGRLAELEASDAEGPRASFSYAIWNYQAIMMCGLALAVCGGISRTATGMEAAVNRMSGAVEDAQWLLGQKWRNYSRGGALAPNGDGRLWPDNAPGSAGYDTWRPTALWEMAALLKAWRDQK